ncbi:MAG: pyridoxamine 5'-phosphate oxidase family protein [Chloroflexi bacterium]|nr:pyridoxamine 5'-phosphate oxidase family protein [Chloroflexota bacterium]
MMSEEFPTPPLNHVRRQDRAVSDETWLRALLHRAPIGYLATQHDGQPFINSNLFVYDEAAHVVYMHTAKTGRTPTNVADNGRFCFTVTEMGRLLPAAVALEFSVEYASVVLFGTAVLVSDEAEATYGLQRLLDKYAPHLTPGQDYRPPVAEELKRTAVFRLNIESWSGKKKEVAADFPGAYAYESATGKMG